MILPLISSHSESCWLGLDGCFMLEEDTEVQQQFEGIYK